MLRKYPGPHPSRTCMAGDPAAEGGIRPGPASAGAINAAAMTMPSTTFMFVSRGRHRESVAALFVKWTAFRRMTPPLPSDSEATQRTMRLLASGCPGTNFDPMLPELQRISSRERIAGEVRANRAVSPRPVPWLFFGGVSHARRNRAIDVRCAAAYKPAAPHHSWPWTSREPIAWTALTPPD